MLSVVMLSVVMLSVVMLSFMVFMLSVILLNVVILSVVAPFAETVDTAMTMPFGRQLMGRQVFALQP